jgi:hypothetical protein
MRLLDRDLQVKLEPGLDPKKETTFHFVVAVQG